MIPGKKFSINWDRIKDKNYNWFFWINEKVLNMKTVIILLIVGVAFASNEYGTNCPSSKSFD